jgi:acyl-CoA hydrolase
MENYKLVLPEHLNHYGYLFGGNLLKWVDEVAYIAASLDYPGCNFVTIGMDRVEFKKSVRQGSLLRLNVKRVREGNTSVQYHVGVYRHDITSGDDVLIFTTNTTYVCIDGQGRKCAIKDELQK